MLLNRIHNTAPFIVTLCFGGCAFAVALHHPLRGDTSVPTDAFEQILKTIAAR
nr:hypothetical protein [uncultured Rhodopila sp.]